MAMGKLSRVKLKKYANRVARILEPKSVIFSESSLPIVRQRSLLGSPITVQICLLYEESGEVAYSVQVSGDSTFNSIFPATAIYFAAKALINESGCQSGD